MTRAQLFERNKIVRYYVVEWLTFSVRHARARFDTRCEVSGTNFCVSRYLPNKSHVL